MSDPSAGNPRSFCGPSRWLWLLAVSVLLLGAPFYVERIRFALVRGEQRALAETARTQLARLDDTAEAFRLVAQSVAPSVVHIDALRILDVNDLVQVDKETNPPDEEEDAGLVHPSGQGSGVIVDPAGYILTNFHVVKGAREFRVRLSDGRVFHTARVVGVDSMTDLAVLKIDGAGLTSAPWGDSQALEAGDWVLAVGNPYGLDRSVTAGIVSAKRRRQIVNNLTYQDFLQTDAVVNPGSSGGPLLNLKGQVVGITTAIVGPGYQGISFAIPSDIAEEVFQRLKTTGKFAPGWLGVALRGPANEEGTLGVEEKVKGAMVTSVFPESPAEKAGILAGDVVIEWNANAVDDFTDLGLLVARTAVDSRATVVVVRGEQKLTLEVPVGERPEGLP